MSLYAQYGALLDGVLDGLIAEGALPADLDRKNVAVEPPRDASHGDLAVNAAMVLAKAAGTNPRALAALIAEARSASRVAAELRGRASQPALDPCVARGIVSILRGAPMPSSVGKGIGSFNILGQPDRPITWALPRGGGRDALASLLEAAGFVVTREYYVNDAGSQVDTLARSAHLRYREALGADIGEIPEGLYPGDYLVPVGQALAAEFGDMYADAPESQWLQLFKTKTVAAMIELIRPPRLARHPHDRLLSGPAGPAGWSRPGDAALKPRAGHQRASSG